MPDLLVETELFVEDADAKFLDWVRVQLAKRGYECDAGAQKDGFWGCCVKNQPVPIWVLVAFVSDDGPANEWGITVEPKLSMLNPANWSKKDTGKRIAVEVMGAIKAACNEPGSAVSIADESEDDEPFEGPIILQMGPGPRPPEQ
jgi:hypothetical protein